ncbi:uncharacterized protein LOC124408330 [Diprion similis]|uniref:uncharacterized protein LOC124408330 n=1 Tax=Diprion similis TaxID=362088 RepID=UPI001EF80395|nr:uncharacterized protein LOC124408330 [Diprion similis]
MFGHTLRAPELLKNKGITFEAWKKWDKTAETLPRKGQKQYEPNNSWLQNKQIEKGLKDRKDLLGIERVERSSQLATAEWLPLESRARVTKKSGQEWTNFGLEENLELYLIPEEALLLLELNRLELTWEGVPLSVQQAYAVLLESNQPKCNIDEYRVYSHLVRQGYRLQRFRYEDDSVLSDMNTSSRRSAKLKRKKLIHDPRGGFGMTRARMSVADSDESTKNDSTMTTQDFNSVERDQGMVDDTNDKQIGCSLRTEKSYECPSSSQPGDDVESRSEINVSNTSETHTCEDSAGTNEVEKIITPLGTNVETAFVSGTGKYTLDGATIGTKKLPSELYDKGVENLPGPSNVEADKRVNNQGHSKKLKIISDETILGDIKILSKWPGTRIQRNVKWMPKRNTTEALLPVTEKQSSGCNTINHTNIDGMSPLASLHLRLGGVTKSPRSDKDLENVERPKKVVHEVIEVSDDEIEEVPRKMSRMEMLNLFPNVMSEASLLQPIPRKYLPCNVRPQLSSVQRQAQYYARSKSRNDDSHEDNYNTSPEGRSRLASDTPGPLSCRNTISRNESTQVNFNGISVNCRNEVSWQGLTFSKESYESRTMYQRFYNQGAPWRSLPNYTVFREPEHVSVHLRTYTDIAIAQHISGRSPFLRRGFSHRQNIWSNMSYYHAGQNFLNLTPRILCDRVSTYNGFSHFGNPVTQRPTYTPKRGCDISRYSNRKYYSNRAAEIGRPSFKVVPGASSWAETKAKWLEEKTITIDDEDCVNKNSSGDESEVEVVAQLVKPLVGPQNMTSLAKVYQSLQIIKNIANRNTVRPRKLEKVNYKISYNLYSTGQHYKKANPGTPMYRVVVFRPELTPFIELAEIIRLQKEAKESPIVFACASQTSVTFAELETIRIPDIPEI